MFQTQYTELFYRKFLHFRLTLDQIEVVRARLKLLQYSDRLSTYEEILGGIHAAEERYDHQFFATFRAQNIVELATDYARVSVSLNTTRPI